MWVKKRQVKNKMPNPKLVKFIEEARKRGFDDYEIREPLLKQGWPSEEIEKVFLFLKPKYKFKNKVSVFLDTELLNMLEKRAKKNMLTIGEQIEDILRRSTISHSKKKTAYDEKLDDTLISVFSRKKTGRKAKK